MTANHFLNSATVHFTNWNSMTPYSQLMTLNYINFRA